MIVDSVTRKAPRRILAAFCCVLHEKTDFYGAFVKLISEHWNIFCLINFSGRRRFTCCASANKSDWIFQFSEFKCSGTKIENNCEAALIRQSQIFLISTTMWRALMEIVLRCVNRSFPQSSSFVCGGSRAGGWWRLTSTSRIKSKANDVRRIFKLRAKWKMFVVRFCWVLNSSYVRQDKSNRKSCCEYHQMLNCRTS